VFRGSAMPFGVPLDETQMKSGGAEMKFFIYRCNGDEISGGEDEIFHLR
jgi:hypothetical protein